MNTDGPKLLLSSVCRPFGAEYGDGFGTSHEGSQQVLWAQGIFRPRRTTPQWSIDFIAENLQIPTVTLNYPRMSDFIEELGKGYDYVGISFNAPTYNKMARMVEASRRYAPRTKIILGGYGTLLGEDRLPKVDHVCRGEGVAFMRSLFGERLDAPIRQPFTVQDKEMLFFVSLARRMGVIFAGLGCPNGCDFCVTSKYFDHKHIPFLPDGRSILEAIEGFRQKYAGMTTFFIVDEDLLLNEKRGRGFLEAIRESDLPPLSLSVFGSVKGLSQYTAEELVEMGVDWVWIGYEGKRADYPKMRGRPYEELFRDFNRHGIAVLSSMIIGFDYQTPELIQEEFDQLLAMNPAICQFLIYGPAIGTSLYERLQAEGRLYEDAYNDYSRQDGFSLCFKHPTISRGEMSAIQRRLYVEEFERLGPSIFRMVDTYLTGYVNLHNHPNRRIREKAEVLGRRAASLKPFLSASKRHLNENGRNVADRLLERLFAAIGPFTRKERFISKIVAPAVLTYADLRLRYGPPLQPELTRRAYRMNGNR